MLILIRMAAIGACSVLLVGATYFVSPKSAPQPTDSTTQEPCNSFEETPDLSAMAIVAQMKAAEVSLAPSCNESSLKAIENSLNMAFREAPRGQQTTLLSYSLIALSMANDQGKFETLIQDTIAKIKDAQWDGGRDCLRSNLRFGGIGYCRQSPPDLHHTALAVSALRQAGVSPRDPCVQRALVFASRCQHKEADDAGGFSIAPIEISPFSNQALSENLRPCGSLTCAGINLLVHGGVANDDSRIRSAMRWIGSNYTLSSNPGMGVNSQARLFDYYWSLTTAMSLLDTDEIVDNQGVKHDWRCELLSAMLVRQQPDGSWENPEESVNPHESIPLVTTSYALMTLSELMKAPSSEVVQGPQRIEARSNRR